MKKYLVTVFLSLFYIGLFAQDLDFAKTVIESLTAKEMDGRGYVNAADKKAAFFIEKEMVKMELIPFDTVLMEYGAYKGERLPNYHQKFNLRINTFPEKIAFNIGRDELIPGIDFVLKPSSGPLKAKEYDLVYLTRRFVKKEKFYEEFIETDYTDQIVVIDQAQFKNLDEEELEYYNSILVNDMRAPAVIVLVDNLMFGVSTKKETFPTFYVLKNKLPREITSIEAEVKHKYIYDYETQNVVGFVEGKTKPNEFIVVGAHYDHLGILTKKAYFPGANDNASGVAMTLDLAKYYSDVFNQPDYSIIFIFFGAEEAGLLGSRFFCNNPYVPLKQMKFMINLDMVGTGETGITVVNGKKHTEEFNKLKELNEKKSYLPQVLPREEAANSDHYYFEVKGVPSFFIYQMGVKDKKYYYHHIKDNIDNVSLAGYEGTFKLIVDFIDALQK
jgi:aminopeptidase YwaD